MVESSEETNIDTITYGSEEELENCILFIT